MDWGFHISVVFTGITVVFLALIILIIAIAVMGKVIGFIDAKKSAPKKAEAPAKPAAPAAPAPVQAVAVQSEDGLTDEVVAAITAAITCVMEAGGNTAPFTIKSIKRAKGASNAWNMAGVLENTRPF